MRKNGTRSRAFTLVEIMIVVGIIGVLASLAIVGVRRYLLNAKTAEAKTAIGRISKDVAVAYAREMFANTSVLGVTNSTGVASHLCPSSIAIPTAIPAAAKFQSNPTTWSGDPGWTCLKFSMTDPQYYMYQYIASGTTGAVNDVFTVQANGDLDNDGVLSTFRLAGQIQSSRALFVAPTISETNPEE